MACEVPIPTNPFEQPQRGVGERYVKLGTHSVCSSRPFLPGWSWHGSDWVFSCQAPPKARKIVRTPSSSSRFGVADGESRPLGPFRVFAVSSFFLACTSPRCEGAHPEPGSQIVSLDLVSPVQSLEREGLARFPAVGCSCLVFLSSPHTPFVPGRGGAPRVLASPGHCNHGFANCTVYSVLSTHSRAYQRQDSLADLYWPQETHAWWFEIL